ncbi:uncharacterized protein [Euphorbia lathyris]|uniref:uncharacterized protein n=1 Tax=Euphorbia lathyris TaxID=212925 RepID=UPI003314354A
MGSQPSNESFFSWQKLEEILPLRELQIALVKLWSYYWQKNLSAKDIKSSNASTSKHKAVHQLILLNEISQHNCADKGEMERVISSKRLLTDSRNLTSEKQVLVDTEIEQISRRLEVLEKESKIMKQELFAEVEEREKLVNEIHQQFQIIFGESGFDESLMVNNFHEMGEVERTKYSCPKHGYQ